MTRPQYLALCVIGAVAVIAYLNTRTLAAGMQRIASPIPGGKPLSGII